jgi:hypothetical protein
MSGSRKCSKWPVPIEAVTLLLHCDGVTTHMSKLFVDLERDAFEMMRSRKAVNPAPKICTGTLMAAHCLSPSPIRQGTHRTDPAE